MSLRAALRLQGDTCADLGSPFTGRVLHLLAENLRPGIALNDRLFAWTGDIGPSGASVPLRLTGALHGLALDGSAPGLAAVYPPNPATSDSDLWHALDAALTDHTTRIDAWLDRPPQTNEVGRSAALIALGHWLQARYQLPLVLSELGASAGLNLNWDRYALRLPDSTFGPADPVLTLHPDWTGRIPDAALPTIARRRGTDLTPLDPGDAADRLRLTAYVWADQAERLARTLAALAAPPATVDRADAADWLISRLKQTYPGHLHLIFHTVAWQYFPRHTQNGARQTIEAAGAAATAQSPLAWFAMEADNAGKGAGLKLSLWPGDVTLAMGRADFHGRWVDWQPPDPQV